MKRKPEIKEVVVKYKDGSTKIVHSCSITEINKDTMETEFLNVNKTDLKEIVTGFIRMARCVGLM